METKRITVSIDPGISGTGIALWEGKTCVSTQNLYPPAKSEWQAAANHLVHGINVYLEVLHPEVVWCEYPEHFTGAFGQMVAKSGDLVKLAYFVGMVSGVCLGLGIGFVPVTPAEWKGQMSKEMTERKIRHILPALPKEVRSHAIDAVGIGLYGQGRFRDVDHRSEILEVMK